MPPARTQFPGRRENPHGRQKSCSECAKAKRRCSIDIHHPDQRCVRCIRLALPCIQPLQPASSDSNSDTIASDLTNGELLGSDWTDAFVADTSSLQHSGSEPTTISLQSLRPGSPRRTMAASNGPGYTPQKILTTSELTAFARGRVEYAMEQMRGAPATMVSSSSTFFIHPNLYEDEMPRSLQDACAACALWSAKNEANANFVNRFITERSEKLATLPCPTNAPALVAHAQALLLYQMMFLFSTDVRHYAQAEVILACMQESSEALGQFLTSEIDPVFTLPSYPIAVASAAWKSYIFRESARRTHIVLMNCESICNLLRGRLTTCQYHRMIGARVTFAASLWKATSAFDFAIAWNTKDHHLVENMDVAKLLETAKVDDIDTFGKVVLTGFMGIDEVRGWFHSRGGTL